MWVCYDIIGWNNINKYFMKAKEKCIRKVHKKKKIRMAINNCVTNILLASEDKISAITFFVFWVSSICVQIKAKKIL